MADTVTRITHQSYGSRVSSACCAFLFCPIFVVLGSWLLIWNEGFSIKQHRALTEGSKKVAEVMNVDIIDPSLNNLPIHFTGLATTTESDPIVDPIFGVTPSSEVALKLKRYVEMYQWTESSHSETIKNPDGSTDTVTTYTYSTDWEDKIINSNNFEESFGHENPDSMRFDSEVFTADGIHVGAFPLSQEVLSSMDWFKPISQGYLNEDQIQDPQLQSETILYHNYFYYSSSGSPSWSQVGDTRVSFYQLPSQVISVVALQSNGVPTSYTASNGHSFLLVEQGDHTTEIMFENAHKAVALQTWLLRLLGFIIIWIGFKSLLEPMAVSTSIIPCIGKVTETVANSASFLLGFCVSIIIIAVAWLAYRPFLSISLILLALCCGFCGMPHKDDLPPTTNQNNGNKENGWYDEVPTAQAVPLRDDYDRYDYETSAAYQEAPITNQRLSYSNIMPIPVSHAMTYGTTTAPPGSMTYGATAPPGRMEKSV